MIGIVSPDPRWRYGVVDSATAHSWADIFNIRVSVPRLDPEKRYLFIIAPHAVLPFWSWPYASFLAQTYGRPVGGGVASACGRLR